MSGVNGILTSPANQAAEPLTPESPQVAADTAGGPQAPEGGSKAATLEKPDTDIVTRPGPNSGYDTVAPIMQGRADNIPVKTAAAPPNDNANSAAGSPGDPGQSASNADGETGAPALTDEQAAAKDAADRAAKATQDAADRAAKEKQLAAARAAKAKQDAAKLVEAITNASKTVAKLNSSVAVAHTVTENTVHDVTGLKKTAITSLSNFSSMIKLLPATSDQRRAYDSLKLALDSFNLDETIDFSPMLTPLKDLSTRYPQEQVISDTVKMIDSLQATPKPAKDDQKVIISQIWRNISNIRSNHRSDADFKSADEAFKAGRDKILTDNSSKRVNLDTALEEFTEALKKADLNKRAYSSHLKKQFDALCVKAGRCNADGTVAAGTVFSDTEPNLPPSIKEILKSYDANSIADLQRKLGLPAKECDGMLGPRTLFHLQAEVFDKIGESIDSVSKKTLDTIKKKEVDLQSLIDGNAQLQSQDLRTVLSEHLGNLQEKLADPTSFQSQGIDFANKDFSFETAVARFLHEKGYSVGNDGILMKSTAGAPPVPATSQEMTTMQADLRSCMADRYTGAMAQVKTVGAEIFDPKTRAAYDAWAAAFEIPPKSLPETAGTGQRAIHYLAQGGLANVQRRSNQIDQAASLNGLAVSKLTSSELQSMQEQFGTRLRIDETNQTIFLAEMTPEQQDFLDLAEWLIKEDNPLGEALREAWSATSALSHADDYIQKVIEALESRLQERRLRRMAVEQAGDAAGAKAMAKNTPPPFQEAIPNEDDTTLALEQQQVARLNAGTSGSADSAWIKILARQLSEPSDAPEASADRRNQKIQEESRNKAEAYTDSVQQRGRELVVERRDAAQVAETSVVGDDTVIRRNKDGKVIDQSTGR